MLLAHLESLHLGIIVGRGLEQPEVSRWMNGDGENMGACIHLCRADTRYGRKRPYEKGEIDSMSIKQMMLDAMP